MPKYHRPGRGFTLIELLVVFLIIVLLVGILLPALQGARNSARSILCTSNLRTLAITMQEYANDYDDRLPRSSSRSLDVRRRASDPSGRRTSDRRDFDSKIVGRERDRSRTDLEKSSAFARAEPRPRNGRGQAVSQGLARRPWFRQSSGSTDVVAAAIGCVSPT